MKHWLGKKTEESLEKGSFFFCIGGGTTNRNYILSAIREYADELIEPQCLFPRDLFAQRSYQQWAVDEILKSIKESKSIPTITVLEDFIRKMDDFSCRGGEGGLIFSVAYDVATEILNIVITMK